MVATPIASHGFCWVLAMMDADAPSTAIGWFLLDRSPFVLLFLICMKLWVLTSSFLASPSKLNWLKTTCIWAFLCTMTFLIWGAKAALQSTGGVGSLMSNLVVVLVSILFLRDRAPYLYRPRIFKRTAVN